MRYRPIRQSLIPGVPEHQQRLDLLTQAIDTLPPRRREAFYSFIALMDYHKAKLQDKWKFR